MGTFRPSKKPFGSLGVCFVKRCWNSPPQPPAAQGGVRGDGLPVLSRRPSDTENQMGGEMHRLGLSTPQDRADRWDLTCPACPFALMTNTEAHPGRRRLWSRGWDSDHHMSTGMEIGGPGRL